MKVDIEKYRDAPESDLDLACYLTAEDNQIEAEEQQVKIVHETTMERVLDAMHDPFYLCRNFTKTYNPHWEEEGRPSPYEPFPDLPYFKPLFELLHSERIILLEKSRDLMVSWVCVGYFFWQMMRVPERRVIFQTQTLPKVVELIDYVKCLYRNMPEWLQDAHPLDKPIDDQPSDEFNLLSGSRAIGIPGGASKIRSYHPWGLLNDESSFQPQAGESYDEALSAVKGKIVFNSSAGPGWYSDFRNDSIILTD